MTEKETRVKIMTDYLISTGTKADMAKACAETFEEVKPEQAKLICKELKKREI